MDVQTMIGEVCMVSPKGYGFILTDAREKFFFRVEQTKAKVLPEVRSVVRFRAVRQNIENQSDRAVEVEVA